MRHTRAELCRVIAENGMQVVELMDHNLVGALGWWWSGCVRRRRTIRVRDTRTFDRLVPFLKFIDPLLIKPFGGVSLIAVATPQQSEAAAVALGASQNG